MADQDRRSSSTIRRAFDLLDLIARTGADGMTLSDLARAASMSVSTCHRYVTTLLDVGALSKDSAGLLVLGVKLVTLSRASLERNALRTQARAELEQLALIAGETVHLGLHTDKGVVYIDKIDPDKAVRLVSRVGSIVPHYCSAMGKALLASLAPADRAPLLAQADPAQHPRALVGPELEAELERVASRGYALDEQEFEVGVRCVGAAITGPAGEPLGAVSVSGPVERLSRELCVELAPSIIAGANRVARRLS